MAHTRAVNLILIVSTFSLSTFPWEQNIPGSANPYWNNKCPLADFPAAGFGICFDIIPVQFSIFWHKSIVMYCCYYHIAPIITDDCVHSSVLYLSPVGCPLAWPYTASGLLSLCRAHLPFLKIKYNPQCTSIPICASYCHFFSANSVSGSYPTPPWISSISSPS